VQNYKKMQEVFDPSEFRQVGHELIDFLADHINDSINGNIEKTIPYVGPEDMYNYWDDVLKNGKDISINTVFETVVEQSTKLHSPRYMGHQVGVISPLSALSSVVTSILNNGQAVYEMGMPANAMERIVTELMTNHIGYDRSSGGFLTSGGTIATLTALLAARANKTNVWDEGQSNINLGIMVSSEAHYAVDRAARIMGLGTKGIIKIPVNDKLQLDASYLEEAYETATAEGIQIFAIVGSVCSTSSGSYDDLQALHKFASARNIWLHADGAHGGAVIFSEKYKHLVNGLDLCDSVVIDWHKMLMIPALITAVLFKNGNDAFNTFHQKAQYLWADPNSLDWYNSGKRTIECTKLMMSLKVFTLIKAHGLNQLAKYVDYTYDLAKEFHTLLNSRKDYESVVEPESNIVCFRKLIDNYSEEQLNKLNSDIRHKLVMNGRFYIVQTTINSILFLRVTLMNPFTTIEHLTELLDLIEEIR
jgi:L-2,4-diaminobutyrate decarboxylase